MYENNYEQLTPIAPEPTPVTITPPPTPITPQGFNAGSPPSSDPTSSTPVPPPPVLPPLPQWRAPEDITPCGGGHPYTPAPQSTPPQGPAAPPTSPKEKKSFGSGKKILLAICVGLFFGIFAGLGFQAVTTASDMIFGSVEQASGEAPGAVQEVRVLEAVPAPEVSNALPAEETTDELKTTGLVESTQSGLAVVTDVTHVAEAVMPAVVSVSNIYTSTFNYFGRQYNNENESNGSGIIVGENETELLIVTNYHVVQDATTLNIQFFDDAVAEAQVKGSQPNMDLAVVAVSLEDISAKTLESIAIATLGDSDALKVGEPAIAIGNAMGYGQSVTVGVISALDRENTYHIGGYEFSGYQIDGFFIQTDAAINPGNSGGALLNIRGEVVGINSSKIGGSIIEGMGYAIPISAAKPIIEDLMVRETRARVDAENQGYIGITGVTVGDEISELYGLPKGVYINKVLADTPAEKSGIVEGDIITHFDGVAVPSWEELLKRMTYYRVGDEVEVSLISGDAVSGYDEKTVTLTLAGRPTE